MQKIAAEIDVIAPEHSPRPSAPLALAQWIERVAITESHAAVEAQGRTSGSWLVRHGAVVGVGSTTITNTAFNRVFIGGEGQAARPDDVAAMLDTMAERGSQQPLVHLHRADRTAPIEQLLVARGLQPFRRAWVKLMREPGPVPTRATSLQVRAAQAEDTNAIADLAVQAHQLHPSAHAAVVSTILRPGWHVYVACDGDEIVSTGALMVRGNIGYLWLAATRPSHRGRGGQTAIVEKRLRVAFALGCRYVFCETGVAIAGEPNPSHDNLVRLGMKPIGIRDNFVYPGTSWS